MGSHSAFFYGTLMAPPVLYRVIYGTTEPEPWQRALTTVRPALLENYRRHKVRYADYPAIVPYDTEQAKTPSSSSVRGTFVTGLLDEDVRRLDIFEGDQYTRGRVRVKVLDKSKIGLHDPVDEARLEDYVESEETAETYIWAEGDSGLEREEWDFEEFRREKMWAWVGMEKGDVEPDTGFADVDRDIEDRQKRDPTGGRGMNGSITRELEAEREKSAAV